jgi:two-component system, OmpR family, response regulator
MLQAKSVFVVEDSELIRKRIIDDVVSMGRFEVVGFAESEGDAVASIANLHPDIVITDLRLRKGSGISVVRRVRAHPYAPPPRIFVLTNYAFPEYKRECLVSGADEFLDKTCEYDRFLCLMQQAA